MRVWRALRDLDARASAWVAGEVARRPLLYRACVLAAHAGDGLVCLGGGALLLLLRTQSVLLQALSLHLAQTTVAVLGSAVLVAALKRLVRRERPQGANSARWSALPKHDVYSFPSGHAARVACIAASVCLCCPSAWLPFTLWAVAVSLARVAVGAHYATDVLAGVGLGVGMALAMGTL